MLGLHDIRERINPILKSPRHASLDSKSRGRGNDSLHRTAAVLIILHSKNHIPHIILTKRSSMLNSHSGEISFPGGQYSPEEDLDLLDTALRETKEEVGLRFRPENIQGRLNSVNTLTSNFTIVPFITLRQRLPEPNLFINEVECIEDIPLLPTLATYQPDF